jgi:hypothetical protein
MKTKCFYIPQRPDKTGFLFLVFRVQPGPRKHDKREKKRTTHSHSCLKRKQLLSLKRNKMRKKKPLRFHTYFDGEDIFFESPPAGTKDIVMKSSH